MAVTKQPCERHTVNVTHDASLCALIKMSTLDFSLRETPEAFADYARLCYRELGAYVKMWITLNEPNDEMVSYQEGHQMLRAHALAWHAYDREFRHAQGGQVRRPAQCFFYIYSNILSISVSAEEISVWEFSF